jgi:uncharacterized protein YjeT (DUF2065 family)
VVIAFGLFLIGLALAIAIRPPSAERFLSQFASSARAHYTEQALRMLVGISMVNLASDMRSPDLFQMFGWLMIVTTIGLLLVPWRWHRAFAARVMPQVYARMRLFAVGAFGLGVFILYNVTLVI